MILSVPCVSLRVPFWVALAADGLRWPLLTLSRILRTAAASFRGLVLFQLKCMANWSSKSSNSTDFGLAACLTPGRFAAERLGTFGAALRITFGLMALYQSV